jgi:predicted  nucleic acid-binding Zn-ribbon protein
MQSEPKTKQDTGTDKYNTCKNVNLKTPGTVVIDDNDTNLGVTQLVTETAGALAGAGVSGGNSSGSTYGSSCDNNTKDDVCLTDGDISTKRVNCVSVDVLAAINSLQSEIVTLNSALNNTQHELAQCKNEIKILKDAAETPEQHKDKDNPGHCEHHPNYLRRVQTEIKHLREHLILTMESTKAQSQQVVGTQEALKREVAENSRKHDKLISEQTTFSALYAKINSVTERVEALEKKDSDPYRDLAWRQIRQSRQYQHHKPPTSSAPYHRTASVSPVNTQPKFNRHSKPQHKPYKDSVHLESRHNLLLAAHNTTPPPNQHSSAPSPPANSHPLNSLPHPLILVECCDDSSQILKSYTHTNKKLEHVIHLENIIYTKADGHCLLHAISLSYPSQLNDEITANKLISTIEERAGVHPKIYKTSEEETYTNQMKDYLVNKRYDNDFVDTVPLIICEALNIQLVIIDSTDKADTVIKLITPDTSTSGGNFNKTRSLVIHFANNHYEGYVCSFSTTNEPYLNHIQRDHLQPPLNVEPVRKHKNQGSHTNTRMSDSVPTRNRFAVLEDEAELVAELGSKEDQLESIEMQQGTIDDRTEVLLIGDHNISKFQSRYKTKWGAINIKSLCQPNLKIESVAPTFDREISNTQTNTPIILQVGAKNALDGTEKTLYEYRELLTWLKTKNHPVHVIGIIPQPNWNNLTVSRVLGLNTRLNSICNKLEVQFSDFWDIIRIPKNYTQRFDGTKSYINEIGQNILAELFLETASKALNHSRSNVRHLAKNEETLMQHDPGEGLSRSNQRRQNSAK